MPCTRSMRSKPSATKKKPDEEEELPSSAPSTPPKTKARSTRATKSKKVSKTELVEGVIDAPKSPGPSASTARSTRSRVRSKAPDPCVSPVPTKKQKVTRSTRKKTNTSKPSKSVVENDDSSDNEDDGENQYAPPESPVDSKILASTSKPSAKGSTVKKTAKAKPKRNTKASKVPASSETGDPIMSDPDASTADEDREHGARQIRTLTYQQLNKRHIIPLKTALKLGVCEVVPRCMEKIMDQEAINRQERAYQELLNAPEVEMPPPQAPAAKTKRAKRARSPEPPPSKISVPTSFNFAGADTRVPAKKKMIMDIPTPDKETTDTPVGEEILPKGSSDSEVDAGEQEQAETKAPEKKRSKAKKKQETQTKQKKLKVKDKEKGAHKEELKTCTPAPVDQSVQESNPVTTEKKEEVKDLDLAQDKVKPTQELEKVEVERKNDLPGNVEENATEKTEKKKHTDKTTDKKQKKGKTKNIPKEDETADSSAEKATAKSKTEKLQSRVESQEEAVSQKVDSTVGQDVAKPTHSDKNVKSATGHSVEQSNVNDDIFEQSIMEICQTGEESAPASTKEEAAAKIEDESERNVGVVVVAKDKIPPLAEEEEKGKRQKSPLLNGTFLVETPKDRKIHEMNSNAEFTPELFPHGTPKADTTFEIPKSNLANQTVTISNGKTDKDNADESVMIIDDGETEPLVPETPECALDPPTNNGTTSTSGGVVSALVKLFSKNKNDSSDSKNAPTSAVEVAPKSRSPSPEFTSDKQLNPISGSEKNDMNSTYILPSSAKVEKSKPTSLLNVTVCFKKEQKLQLQTDGTAAAVAHQGLVPILPPSSFFQPANSVLPQDNPAQRTFIKEPPSLDVVVEEEDEGGATSSSGKLWDKVKPVGSKQATKDSKKGTSSSSSSSSSSLKSATSQPCLLGSSKKQQPLGSSKGPSYGSTGKLHDVYKSKPLEEAEKRRLDLMQSKKDNATKKMEEWKKKTEKKKLEEEKKKLEDEKKLKEKLKFVQPPSGGVILKKPAPILNAPCFIKPKVFGAGPSGSKLHSGPTNFVPPLSKYPFHPKPAPTQPDEEEMDESFKTASTSHSFLDSTIDGPLSSYDITRYEDLDEDMKHRENKTVPTWASEKDSLKIALFSMVYLPDYQQSLQLAFPKPDRSYKLFPPRKLPM